jgi:hypothetical protein
MQTTATQGVEGILQMLEKGNGKRTQISGKAP